jgi:hypothetical protein
MNELPSEPGWVGLKYDRETTRSIFYVKLLYTPLSRLQELPTFSTPTTSELVNISPSNMAPRLSPSKLFLIRDMIDKQNLTTSQMAEEAECIKLTIINMAIWKRLCPPNLSRSETNRDTPNNRSPLRSTTIGRC